MSGEWALDGEGRLVELGAGVEFVTFGRPAPIDWQSVDDVPAPIFGRRVAVSAHDGVVYDLRAASEVYEQGNDWWVNVVTEQRWWEWARTDDRPERPPRAVPWPSRYIWIESRQVQAQTESGR